MHHHHDHPHEHHVTSLKKIGRAFILGIVLNVLFVVIEAAAGLFTGSLALLADAGHNLMDVISLILAMVAFRLSKIKPNDKFTYGYQKTTVVVALLNAIILLVAIIGIGYEATMRLIHPAETHGSTIAIVAGIGIVINSVTAFFFYRDKDKDLNIKGAYLHLVADAAVSLGVVVAGIAIYFTDYFWLDSVVSYIIILVIFIGTWRLLKDSVRLSLDGVPKTVDVEKIKSEALNIDGVNGIHHIHIWAMSTTQNALTAHLVIDDNLSPEQQHDIKHHFRNKLKSLNIQHATIETETEEEGCADEDC